MEIKTAEYLLSAVNPKQYPKNNLPEIALVGRSNVGKSSLINKIVNRKKLARTSSQPGKTRTLNFYLINEEFFLVDLPGFGFAKVSRQQRNEWGEFIEEYMLERDALKGALQVVDIRHEPTANDVMMFEWLDYYQIPVMIVATKADKISRGKYQKHLKIIREKMALPFSQEIIIFSSQTGEGLEDIKNWLDEHLG